MDDKQCGQECERKRWLSVDRGLMAGVIVLQIAILILLFARRPSHEPVATVGTPGRPGADARYVTLPTPWQQAHTMMEDMGALFESAVTEFERKDAFFDLDEGWDAAMTSPAMDMREEPDCYLIVFSLPTPRPSDLQVLLDGRVVTILTIFDQPELIHRYGEPLRFEKRVRLPGPVGDATLAGAQISNGMLRISVPKGGRPNPETGYRRLM